MPHGEMEIVLGAGLEPASLSAYAPQTYVSAIPPPERSRTKNFPQSDTTGKSRLIRTPTPAHNRNRNWDDRS